MSTAPPATASQARPFRWLLDLPMRRKLMAAFLVTTALPLTAIAAFTLGSYLSYSEHAAADALADKLSLASLMLDQSARSLESTARRMAGDQALTMSLGLGLTQAANQQLEQLRDEQTLDLALAADAWGMPLAGGAAPGTAPYLPLAGAALPSGAWWSAGSGLVVLQASAPFPSEETRAWTAYRFGDGSDSAGSRLIARMEARLGARLFLTDGTSIIHPAPGTTSGSPLPQAPVLLAAWKSALPGQTFILAEGPASWRAASLGLPGPRGEPVAWIGVAVSEAELLSGRNFTLAISALVFLLSAIGAIAAARWFAGFIARPIAAIAEGSRQIIQGNFAFRFEPQGRDEIGLMTEDFAVMSLQMQRMVQELNAKVDAHREAEAQVRTLAAGLEERVDARTRELSESLELLRATQRELVESEKMAALSHLVVGVAHELNTPIGNSLTSVSYLEDRITELGRLFTAGTLSRSHFDETLASLHTSAAMARQGLERAGKLVGFFKQMAVGLDDETAVGTELRTTVDDAIQTIRLKHPAPGITLENLIAPGLVAVAPPGALLRAVYALVENAVVHGCPNGQGTVRIGAALHDGGIDLLVEDTGPGIPEAERQRIYEPFFTTARTKGHIGLGLSIAFNLVNTLLGGTIRSFDRPGGGSVFIINLALSTRPTSNG